ncbi:hypothetical protein RvY_07916 [Ramazzottius varieornatus]|uniref:Protein quiver n=1 Tax=Ramazzottius varieornatus TaxID=947166 RepID=A0A1D1VD99_RAMVA|nr:hypothetical protein RvY_07916 [Ramazzottius varieornatus]
MDWCPQKIFTFFYLLAGLLKAATSISCRQCKNYSTFFRSPQLNTFECTNSSNWLDVTCDGNTRFCLKLFGAMYGSATASPIPNTLDGIQRGCATVDALRAFGPPGNPNAATAGCWSGDRNVSTSYQQIFDTNLMPIYRFSGTYCLCAEDSCNAGVSTSASTLAVLLVTFSLLVRSLL